MNNPKDASRSTVYVYDSLHGKLTAEIKELISHFHQGNKIKMFVMNTQLQKKILVSSLGCPVLKLGKKFGFKFGLPSFKTGTQT